MDYVGSEVAHLWVMRRVHMAHKGIGRTGFWTGGWGGRGMSYT